MTAAARLDVVVVGAGFAGLSAARALVAEGADVVVLEAADRVGGRTDSVLRDGVSIELGGQWTGPGQGHVAALVRELGGSLFDTPHEGVDLVIREGVVTAADRDQVTTGLADAVGRIDELAGSLPDDLTSGGPNSWDELPLAEWLEAEIADVPVRRALRRTLEGLMTVPADEMSLLTVLHGAKTSGTLAAALGIDGGAQEQRVSIGLHGLAQRLADDLGERILLNSPVRAVEQTATEVVIHATEHTYRADHAVVAVPPSGWARIAFDPALPAAHAALPSAMPLGSVIKVQAIFERPFWRESGLSGLVVDDTGPFGFMADNSHPEREVGVLVSFMSAADARGWGDAALGADSSDSRRDAFLRHLALAFRTELPPLVDYVDRDWAAVPWVGGGYSGVMRPGGWTSCGSALREPVGRVHWASSESASMWTGYVDGAIQSGLRAASEVLGEAVRP